MTLTFRLMFEKSALMTMVSWYLSARVLSCFCLRAVVKAYSCLMSPSSRSSMWGLGFPTETNINDNGLYFGGFNKAMPKYIRIVFFLIISLCGIRSVCCHARLMEPPSRSSMWRNGYETPTNYDDNGLYCGGFQVQWQRNSGKCGICGDPYDMPHPRDNEAGGKYGRGIISKTYTSGQVIEAIVDVTTNHRGYFEFKICPNNNVKKEASQECLDKHVLRLAKGGTKYYITDYKRSGDFAVLLHLPKGLTCSQCVFQWTYVAGNNWGVCDDGNSRLGCGPQETFRGCADIAILKHPGSYTPYPSQNDIGYKFQTKTSHKQKLFKETLVTNYPDYEAEISSQILTDKSTVTSQDKVKNKSRKRKRPFSTWMATELTADINQRTSLVYNATNYKWKTSKHSTDTENKSEYYLPTTHSYFNKITTEKDKWLVYNATNYKWNTSKRSTDTVDKSEYYPPTTHSYFNKMTTEKDKWSTSKRSTNNDNTNAPTTYSYSKDNWIASKGSTNTESKNEFYLPTTHSYPSGNPSVMVLESESKLNKMLQELEGKIQLLRFYLQEDPGSTTFVDTTGTAPYKDTVGSSTYQDTIGTSTYGDTIGTSTYADTVGASTYPDTIGTSTYADTVGASTYPDTVGQSTADGVNKIVKDYWYL
ncbi:hypothetical protein JTE90_016244 [Oedothorax gibbosus]|uniref:Chitin-binding type-4 domain-containing protein n=1 Tax=Oedothorax gibbosus TaxID=931172 RepID=A0AAV6VQL6_9ARAC|nr:hypothetical protein JTE90_016244 [Oedothorax gibbosus]